MNSKDLLKAIGDIDDKYLIEEAEREERDKITWVDVIKNIKLKYILVPACLIFITVIGIYKSGMFTSDPDIAISKKEDWIIKEIEVDKSITQNTAIVPKWDEMSISQQFYEVEYNNSRYSSRITKISSESILGNVGTSILTGYDTYTNITYNKKGELYSIKNISDKCAIAVKFENEEDYYVYVNSYYRPATLGDFMKDLQLEEITSFGTIYYNYWEESVEAEGKYKQIEFYNVDNKIIWQKLFDNAELENIYSDTDTNKYRAERFSQSINISVNIPILGYKNISVSLTDKGYLLTNILDTGKGFYIGEGKIQEFLEYIKENYDGYEIVYIETNESTDTDSTLDENVIEDKILKMENMVDGYVVEEVDMNKVSSHINSIEPYIPEGM